MIDKKKEILDLIEEALVGNAHLDDLSKRGNDPFKILISTILSARTRDSSTKKATDTLFAKYKTPKQIALADVEDLRQLIRNTGFYNVKGARIKEVARIIVEDHASKVPKNYDDLVDLPGVGSKTANCVLVYAFQIPAIPVDTHVHRIPNRIGWIETKTPKQTEKELKRIIPKNQWIRVNRIFVKFGQQICIPINPKCEQCPIFKWCPRDFSMEIERREKEKVRKKKKTQ